MCLQETRDQPILVFRLGSSALRYLQLISLNAGLLNPLHTSPT